MLCDRVVQLFAMFQTGAEYRLLSPSFQTIWFPLWVSFYPHFVINSHFNSKFVAPLNLPHTFYHRSLSTTPLYSHHFHNPINTTITSWAFFRNLFEKKLPITPRTPQHHFSPLFQQLHTTHLRHLFNKAPIIFDLFRFLPSPPHQFASPVPRSGPQSCQHL